MESLKISRIKKDTEHAKTFYFDISGQEDKWKYKAGQYITIEVDINGDTVRRAYSMSTAPENGELGITVKKVNDGRVSGYLHDQVKEGSEIKVLPPEGKFVVLPDPDQRKDYYFFAAGSGITPIMSMINNILNKEPMSCCHLLYGSRSEEEIIFYEELKSMEESHRDQIHVVHTLSKPTEIKKGGIKGLFGAKVISWRGLKGRIDSLILHNFMEQYPGRAKKKEYFVCGPGTMIQNVYDTLGERGVSKEEIKREYFSNPDQKEKTASAAPVGTSAKTKLVVHMEGETFELDHTNDKTILETIMDSGKNPPYSCTAGACSTCVAKVLNGKVTMDECFALDDDEISKGYVLTCQGRAESDVVEIKYEG